MWLCKDAETGAEVALKVQKSAEHYTEAAFDEIDILETVAQKNDVRLSHDRPTSRVVRLLDRFFHEGPHGKHMCMVFETLGDNLLALIKRYNYKGISSRIVRRLAWDTMCGLDFLHRVCQVIHTDLKPENVRGAIFVPRPLSAAN